MADPIRVAPPKETARRLREAMDDRNIRAVELVELTGISKGSISQYVNGVHSPSNKSASIIGKLLKVSPIWLMGFDVPKYDAGIQQGFEKAEFIAKYDALTVENKKMVNTMVDALFKSQSKEDM